MLMVAVLADCRKALISITWIISLLFSIDGVETTSLPLYRLHCCTVGIFSQGSVCWSESPDHCKLLISDCALPRSELREELLAQFF